MARRSPLHLLFRRLLLALASAIVAIAAAELIYRGCEDEPLRSWIVGPDGKMIDRDAAIAWLRQEAPARDAGALPSGGLRPGARFRVVYRPRTRDCFAQDGSVAYEIGRHGFRDLDFSLAKRPGEFRVLAIGDSFTFGLGMPLELTWVQRLEGMLRRGRSQPVEVVNAGFVEAAHEPSGYERWLSSDGMRLDPDLVLVGFCLNDMGPVPMLSYPVVPRTAVLGGVSHLLDDLVHGYQQLAAREADRSALLPQLELIRDFETWHAAQRGLLGMQGLAARHDVPFAVVVFPMLTELERNPFARLHAIVREFCARNGMRCLDLEHAFDGHRDEDLWVHPTDQHPNEVAAEIIAERIHRWLENEHLVPE
ncbi:MAG: SGNH/GDSL hydrolase family protein [Planctomycetota bacterium]